MTTIAYRDGVIAADSQSTAGDSIVGECAKIARNRDGDLAGAAGDAGFSYAFLSWFMAGEKGEAPEAKCEDNCFDRGCVFRANGTIEVYEPRGLHLTEAKYYALGSGRPEALGAMFAGADPVTAVRAAMAHDPRTGGTVWTLSREVCVAEPQLRKPRSANEPAADQSW